MKLRSIREKLWRRETRFAYMLLAPCLLVIVGLEIYPIIFSFFLTFQRVDLTEAGILTRFVGLENWAKMVYDSGLPPIWTRTVYFTAMDVGLSFLLGLGFALVLNEEFRGRSFCRVVLLIPWAIPIVCSGRMWYLVFHSGFGILNTILIKLNLIKLGIMWLEDSRYSMNSVIIAQVWTHVPLVTLFILAALQTVPKELYEAAVVDGAGKWHRFRHVTLPHIRTVVLLILIVATITSFKVFDMIYIMTMGYHETMVWYFNVFVQAFKLLYFDYGVTLAYGLFIVILLLTALYLRLFPVRRR